MLGQFGAILYSFGPVQFEVFPLNVQTIDHTTASDWARKEIAGAAIYREWVGENDEEIHLRGRVFPHFFGSQIRRRVEGGGDSYAGNQGGLGHLDILDNIRRLGQAHLLVRGDGWKLGWFVIERLSRGHNYLAADGVGQQIDFDAQFQRVPVPDPTGFAPGIYNILV